MATKNKPKAEDPVALEPADAPPRRADMGPPVGFLESVRPHLTKILVVLVGLGVVLGAASIYSWMGHRKEAKATKLFGNVSEVMSREVKPPTPPVDPAAPPVPPTPPPAEGDEPTYANAADKAQAVLASIDLLKKEAGTTGVAADASLLAAGQLYDLGKWDDAAAAYKDAAAKVSPLLRPLAQEGLGYSLEAKALAAGDPAAQAPLFQQAKDAFAAIQTDEKGPSRDLCLYHQGRILAKLGQKDEAVKLYKQVVEKFPTSALVPDANARLAQLEAE